MPKDSRIVCAANLYDNGIVLGVRHFDGFMHTVIENRKLHKEEPIQGFVDQYGNFLDREEAYIVAKRQNQIIRDHDKEGVLFSEHLY